MIDLPDLWDCDAVAEWLQQEIQEALLELLKQDKPLRCDEEGRIKVMQVIVDVINPYA